MAKVSNLQITNPRTFAGLTEENNLFANYLAEPEKIGSFLAYAFGINQDQILTLLTGGIGNVKYIGTNEYQWDIMSRNDKSVEVLGNYGDGGATPGIGGSPFRVKLKNKYFTTSDNLVSNNGTYVRVQEEPYQEGTGYVYTFVLADTNPQNIMSLDQITAGARFSKDFSTVGESSTKGGSVIYDTPYKMKNCLTTLRKDVMVTRSAAKTPLVVDVFDPNDPKKSTRLWTDMARWTALAEFHTEIEKSMMYSIYNKNTNNFIQTKDGNNRPVFTGAGLRAQIAPSNVRYYSQLSYNLLEQFLIDLSYSANRWGGDYKFVALTGKMGMIEFSNAILDKAKTLGFLVLNDGRFISGSGQELIFEGQFVTVKFLNGVELTVKEFPLYDDLERNRILHPKSLKPVESYRFTILNVGRKDGKSNIRKVARKDSDMMLWHTGGSVDPNGTTKKSIDTMGSSSLDGYEFHMISECGLQLEDPLSCGELILDI